MPNRFQRNSIGELVCRVPLQRGSLLKSIENLVKTIETSENAVMIPTLLRDKVRIDAWELLFVAKILKASILGHDDLVEFYMNHIHQNSLNSAASATNGNGGQSAAQTPNALLLNGQMTPNGCGSPALSPSLARQQSSPSMASPLLVSHPVQTNGLGHNRQGVAAAAAVVAAGQLREQQEQTIANSSASSVSSNHSSQTTNSTATTTGGTMNNQTGPSTANPKSSSNSSTSWTTAVSRDQQQQQPNSAAASLTSDSPFNSAASSLSSAGGHQVPLATGAISEPIPMAVGSSQEAANGGGSFANPLKLLSSSTSCDELIQSTQPPPPPMPSSISTTAQDGGLLAARPLLSRLAQPPSLLQLTTTNNHINSVSELLSSSPMDPSLDSLSQHLISLQQQQQATQLAASNFDLGAGLSLTIPTGNSNGLNQGDNPPPPSSQVATPTTTRHELRSSRSAGCLFRANSGASSPRTSATPYPQAETLAGAANQNGLVGDPTSLVKLLLQVEQLKASIVHVNTLLESVVDLYKKSIDNISQ